MSHTHLKSACPKTELLISPHPARLPPTKYIYFTPQPHFPHLSGTSTHPHIQTRILGFSCFPHVPRPPTDPQSNHSSFHHLPPQCTSPGAQAWVLQWCSGALVCLHSILCPGAKRSNQLIRSFSVTLMTSPITSSPNSLLGLQVPADTRPSLSS